MGVNFNDRVLIVGKTQSGKTTFARYLFSQFTGTRRILVNVKGRVKLGVVAVRDVERIDWAAPVIDFIPRTIERDVFEALYERIWAAGGPCVVWLDEGAAVTGAGYAPVHLRVLQQQGAEPGIGHLVCVQRPVNCATELRTEAEHYFIFGLPSQIDLKVLADEMGVGVDELGARIRQLREREGEYSFLWWPRATGELVDCAPLDVRWVDAPIGVPAAPGAPSAIE